MDRSNIEVDYETGLIPPWLAPHPDENAPVLNFPVRIDQIFYDEDLFLSGLSREWLPKNAILFQKNFPIYLSSESTSLLAYYNRIVTFCLEWRVFVPPLHTLRVGNPLGVWYAKLSALTKSQITSTFSSLLALSLRQSQTKLVSDRILGPFVGLGVCGYDMLYNLAVQGRHPILYKSAKDPHVPEQTENTAIPAYINNWIAYIHLRSLSGYHLSDRYFIQQFISGLYSTLKTSLGDWLQMQVDRRPLGTALPDSFAPHCLLVLLMQRAEFCDSMDMIHSTPRSYARPSQQQLPPRGPQQPPLYIRSLDETHDTPALALQALGATTAPATGGPSRAAVCFMCGSHEHQLNTCPRMAAVRDNNYARRMLQRELASPGTDARPLRQVAFQPSAAEDATLVDASSAPIETFLAWMRIFKPISNVPPIPIPCVPPDACCAPSSTQHDDTIFRLDYNVPPLSTTTLLDDMHGDYVVSQVRYLCSSVDSGSPGDSRTSLSPVSTASPPADILSVSSCFSSLAPGLSALHGLDASRHSLCALRSTHSMIQHRAHCDGGAMASTTDQLACLWHVRWLSRTQSEHISLIVADDNKHHPTATGFLRVPSDDPAGFSMIQCYLTSTIPATIISPASMGLELDCIGYTSTSNFDGTQCGLVLRPRDSSRPDVCFSLQLDRGLLYSQTLILPTSNAEKFLPRPPVPPATPSGTVALRSLTLPVCSMSRDQLRILWHQRLGHLNSRCASELHKSASGIPHLGVASELEKCPICLAAKLHKAKRKFTSSRRATQCNQGLAIDFGFIVQSSASHSTRSGRLCGLNGETCYCLIVDHHSGALYGRTFRSKAPPVQWFNEWLAQHGLPQAVSDKYVRFDLGGELGRSPAVVDLWARAGYHVEPTAPDSSSSNGPGERPHRTIAEALRTMLGGAGLAAKFWPYAFHHYIRLYNLTVHSGRTQSPFELCTGRRPDLSRLRVFGCRVYALPARPRRPAKPETDTRTGIFLGFTDTMKDALYYDLASKIVKPSAHVAFDEAMSDLAYADRPPNARLLTPRQSSDLPDILDVAKTLPALDVSISPFTTLSIVTVPFCPASPDSMLGVTLDLCTRLGRVYISAVLRPFASMTLRQCRRAFLGSYIVSVDDSPTFAVDDVRVILLRLAARSDPPATVSLLLAPERLADFDDRPSPLHLRVSDLRHIHDIVRLTVPCPRQLLPIARLQTETMTAEERLLTSFTRRHLQKLSNWPAWDAAFDKQLDSHLQAGTIADPIVRPKTSLDGTRPPNIVRIQWSNLVKPCGTRKCRACIDGSPRAAPFLRAFAQTYASCVAQPCQRLFFAVSAHYGYTVLFGDTSNAFQQSPPPAEPCYLRIDDAYRSWYKKRYGSDVNPVTHVVPVKRALQGHPEAGALWERMINEILCGPELKFTSTTHERNLYRGTVDGATVLVCRQVDDFAIASSNVASAEKVLVIINSHATTDNQGPGEPSPQGLFTRYNGVDIHQTRDYTLLSCATYINRLLQTHGWETPAEKESDRHDTVPLSPSLVDSLQLHPGPAEKTPAARALADTAGFSYRQVLGELIYAYTICRFDIGFAVTFLARFSQHPSREHYTAIKGVVKYLRRTVSWGLVYWRKVSVASLPSVALRRPVLDPTLPPFPGTSDGMTLTGYVDAAHATDLTTRRSVTGLVFVLAGGAIVYRSSVQPTVATSSTEAEFIAAVSAAKTAKYLRSVLQELHCSQPAPTPLYCDNEAAINMINENRPTTRSRHIDIQHFAIQEWRRNGDIHMSHIPGVINCSDGATKGLSWTLHSRHARRAMGHFGPPGSV